MQEREHFRLQPAEYRVLVNINTGETAPRRRWPAEHFRTVVEDLSRRPGVRCILIGGPQDQKVVDGFHAGLSEPERVVNLAGRELA